MDLVYYCARIDSDHFMIFLLILLDDGTSSAGCYFQQID
jgi:hypothetical protein